MRHLLCCCIAGIVLFPVVSGGQDPQTMAERIAAGIAADNALAQELRAEGVKHESGNSILCAEKGTLAEEELADFARLAAQAIDGIQKLLGITFDRQHFKADKIEYFISSKAAISHAHRDGLQPFVYITPDRIKNKRAPYVHETTHTLVRWRDHPVWLQEGLPTYVQEAVVAKYGGYNWSPGNPEGKPIDALAREYLATEMGKKAVALVGHPALSRDSSGETMAMFRPILQDRTLGAPAFYNLSASFVKYLTDKSGAQTLVTLCKAEDVALALRTATGKTIEQWKTEWLEFLSNPR